MRAPLLLGLVGTLVLIPEGSGAEVLDIDVEIVGIDTVTSSVSLDLLVRDATTRLHGYRAAPFRRRRP